MAYFADEAKDNGLQWLTDNCTALYICSAEPATYTEATSTYDLGAKTGLTVGSPGDASPNGRKVTVPAVVSGSPGNVTDDGTAAYWGLVKPTATTALGAAGALSASQGVTNGNTWTSAAFDIRVPDAS